MKRAEKMNTATYYKHIRGLGAFPAIGALALAREAAALDVAAAERAARNRGADLVSTVSEYGMQARLSFSVKVY
jgi:putative heme iron utilization protein